MMMQRVQDMRFKSSERFLPSNKNYIAKRSNMPLPIRNRYNAPHQLQNTSGNNYLSIHPTPRPPNDHQSINGIRSKNFYVNEAWKTPSQSHPQGYKGSLLPAPPLGIYRPISGLNYAMSGDRKMPNDYLPHGKFLRYDQNENMGINDGTRQAPRNKFQSNFHDFKASYKGPKFNNEQFSNNISRYRSNNMNTNRANSMNNKYGTTINNFQNNLETTGPQEYSKYNYFYNDGLASKPNKASAYPTMQNDHIALMYPQRQGHVPPQLNTSLPDNYVFRKIPQKSYGDYLPLNASKTVKGSYLEETNPFNRPYKQRPQIINNKNTLINSDGRVNYGPYGEQKVNIQYFNADQEKHQLYPHYRARELNHQSSYIPKTVPQGWNYTNPYANIQFDTNQNMGYGQEEGSAQSHWFNMPPQAYLRPLKDENGFISGDINYSNNYHDPNMNGIYSVYGDFRPNSEITPNIVPTTKPWIMPNRENSNPDNYHLTNTNMMTGRRQSFDKGLNQNCNARKQQTMEINKNLKPSMKMNVRPEENIVPKSETENGSLHGKSQKIPRNNYKPSDADIQNSLNTRQLAYENDYKSENSNGIPIPVLRDNLKEVSDNKNTSLRTPQIFTLSLHATESDGMSKSSKHYYTAKETLTVQEEDKINLLPNYEETNMIPKKFLLCECIRNHLQQNKCTGEVQLLPHNNCTEELYNNEKQNEGAASIENHKYLKQHKGTDAIDKQYHLMPNKFDIEDLDNQIKLNIDSKQNQEHHAKIDNRKHPKHDKITVEISTRQPFGRSDETVEIESCDHLKYNTSTVEIDTNQPLNRNDRTDEIDKYKYQKQNKATVEIDNQISLGRNDETVEIEDCKQLKQKKATVEIDNGQSFRRNNETVEIDTRQRSSRNDGTVKIDKRKHPKYNKATVEIDTNQPLNISDATDEMDNYNYQKQYKATVDIDNHQSLGRNDETFEIEDCKQLNQKKATIEIDTSQPLRRNDEAVEIENHKQLKHNTATVEIEIRQPSIKNDGTVKIDKRNHPTYNKATVEIDTNQPLNRNDGTDKMDNCKHQKHNATAKIDTHQPLNGNDRTPEKDNCKHHKHNSITASINTHQHLGRNDGTVENEIRKQLKHNKAIVEIDTQPPTRKNDGAVEIKYSDKNNLKLNDIKHLKHSSTKNDNSKNCRINGRNVEVCHKYLKHNHGIVEDRHQYSLKKGRENQKDAYEYVKANKRNVGKVGINYNHPRSENSQQELERYKDNANLRDSETKKNDSKKKELTASSTPLTSIVQMITGSQDSLGDSDIFGSVINETGTSEKYETEIKYKDMKFISMEMEKSDSLENETQEDESCSTFTPHLYLSANTLTYAPRKNPSEEPDPPNRHSSTDAIKIGNHSLNSEENLEKSIRKDNYLYLTSKLSEADIDYSNSLKYSNNKNKDNIKTNKNLSENVIPIGEPKDISFKGKSKLSENDEYQNKSYKCFSDKNKNFNKTCTNIKENEISFEENVKFMTENSSLSENEDSRSKGTKCFNDTPKNFGKINMSLIEKDKSTGNTENDSSLETSEKGENHSKNTYSCEKNNFSNINFSQKDLHIKENENCRIQNSKSSENDEYNSKRSKCFINKNKNVSKTNVNISQNYSPILENIKCSNEISKLNESNEDNSKSFNEKNFSKSQINTSARNLLYKENYKFSIKNSKLSETEKYDNGSFTLISNENKRVSKNNLKPSKPNINFNENFVPLRENETVTINDPSEFPMREPYKGRIYPSSGYLSEAKMDHENEHVSKFEGSQKEKYPDVSNTNRTMKDNFILETQGLLWSHSLDAVDGETRKSRKEKKLHECSRQSDSVLYRKAKQSKKKQLHYCSMQSDSVLCREAKQSEAVALSLGNQKRNANMENKEDYLSDDSNNFISSLKMAMDNSQ